jgi:APA family basic amino acid/polyamine antiporter
MGGEVPAAAIALQTGLAVLVLWVTALRALLGYIGFTLGLSAAATVVGLLALRRREGAERVPIPGYPWVPAIFVTATLATAGFMVARQPVEALLGLLTVGAGLPVYAWMKRVSPGRDA